MSSIKSILLLLLSFVGLWTVAFCLALFVLKSISAGEWRTASRELTIVSRWKLGSSELMIVWWAVGFLVYLVGIGYVSDVPKEVMYVVPAFVLAAVSPVPLGAASSGPWTRGARRVGTVCMLVFAAVMFIWSASGSLGRAGSADAFRREWRETQLEMAGVLSSLPDRLVWQSYTMPDWGGPLPAVAYVGYGKTRLDAGPDFFSNLKSYWDAYYPGLSPAEVKEKLYERTKASVGIAVVLKDPAKKPEGMEEYSYSIAAYISARVQSDDAWRYYGEIAGKPFGSGLAFYVREPPPPPEVFERALRNLKLDGKGNENPFSR